MIDSLWMEHLEAMSHLRSSVRLRAYGQRDPLVEYKKEGLRIFKDMESTLAHNLANILPNISAELKQEQPIETVEVKENVNQLAGGKQKPVVEQQPKQKEYAGTGRNEPCPCGSGKKYKKCHGI